MTPAFRPTGWGHFLGALLVLSGGLLPSDLLHGGALPLLPSPGASGLSAQGGELARVDAMVAEGRFGEGRTILEGWLDRSWGTASRAEREQGLWLRAVLTIDPALAELDFRRLVVEYPGGSLSDAALLRLAMIARARGDLAGARQYLQILVRDYPQSPHRLEARTHLVRWETAGGTVAPPSGTATGSAPPSPTAAPPATPPAAPPAPPAAIAERVGVAPSNPAAGSYTVQLGAFSVESGARGLATDPRFSGTDLRVVRIQGDDLVRVRMGTFQSQDDARREVERLRTLGVDAIVSVDRDREVPLR